MTTITVETDDGKIFIDTSGVTITTYKEGKGIQMDETLQKFIESSYYLLCELEADPELLRNRES